MILEFCAENFTKVPVAIAQGAQRIELCDNLAESGTTPSYAVIEQTIKYAHAHQATVATMIRPRGGDFIYNEDEFEMMKQDLIRAKKLNTDAVVFGCLNEAHRIHRTQVKKLVALSGDMATVFHMAFDEIPRASAKEEMEWLIAQGVTRILTHGGRTGTVFENEEWLREMIAYANGRIEILIGGGVTSENYEELAARLPTNQFHGTKIVKIEE
jgi:copper homeostasis protein